MHRNLEKCHGKTATCVLLKIIDLVTKGMCIILIDYTVVLVVRYTSPCNKPNVKF